ncbi:helix-turn-helix domain-containing protein [Pseudanabaena mucicola]|uniref:helix-turn-helix domain-containing protein n=1 Tax=Pseudanabaena mucicola TaxID=71190 RepID=UPI001680A28F|nr:helix-turn-helix domain-containing protein [Pseudanabaena mucicola]
MNITTSKQAEKLAEIGARFKKIREEKDLSIPHLTAMTLISERYLRAIENGEIESLPEPVYVRGFIRKYGDALGLGDLSAEFPLNPVIAEQKWAGSAAAELRPLHLYALYVGVIAGAVGLLATFMNAPDANRINDSQTNFGDAAKLTKAAAPIPIALKDVLLPKVGGLGVLRKDSTGSVSVAVPTIVTNTPPAAATNQTVSATVSTIAANSVPTATNNSQPINPNLSNTLGNLINSTNTPTSFIGTNGEFEFVGNKPVNVGIVMRGESWLRITVDGKTEFEGVLNEGKKLAWSGDRQISIRAGNASAVGLSYNKQAIQLLGKEGEVTEKIFGLGANQDSGFVANNPRLRGLVMPTN